MRRVGAVLVLCLATTACGAGMPVADEGAAPTDRDPAAATTTTTVRPPTSAPTPATTPTTTTPVPPPPAIDPVLAPWMDGRRPVPAADPGGLAIQLVATDRAIRDPSTAPDVLAVAGHLQQVAYRQLGARPEWDGPVLATVPDELRADVLHHIGARREFTSLQGGRLPRNVPAWRIVEPLPAAELLALYREAEARFGVAWPVLAAVNLVETGMGRIVGLSVAGARGPMQFIPATWDAYGMGGNVDDPRDAIMGAANYLAANGAARGTDDGLDNALFRYNNSQRYVRGVRHYAAVMADDERAFLGLHAWQIHYVSVVGDLWLPTGYERTAPVPAAQWLAENPQ